MANLTTIDMKMGALSSAAVTANSAAASQTIPAAGKPYKQLVRVYNGDGGGHLAGIIIKAPVDAAKQGARASLGDLAVEVADGETKYIGLSDTARFMDMSTGLITVEAVIDTGGALDSLKLEFVQL